MKFFSIVGLIMVSLVGHSLAQQGNENRQIQIQIGSGNEVSNESGVIDENVQVEGIVVINGKVSIDGVKIPRGVKKYRSPKSGKNYLIEWGKNDNVSVTEQ